MEALKEELIEKIRNTNNENLLQVVKEDIAFYEKVEADNTLGLSEEEHAELKELAEEPHEKDTITFDAFKKTLQHWRTHS